MEGKIIAKKSFKRISATVVLVLLLFFLFSHGIVIIKAPPGDGDVNLSLKNETITKKINLKAGKTKVMILGAGKYTAEFESGDRLTGYRFSTRRFFIPKTLQAELKKQRLAESLGIGNNSCGIDSPDGLISTYYTCDRVTRDLPVIYDGSTERRPVYDQTVLQGDFDSVVSASAPYMSDLLTIIGRPGSKEVSISKLDLNNGTYSSAMKVTLPSNFTANNYTLRTDVHDKTNPRFILYARDAEKFLVFEQASSPAYKTFDLPKFQQAPQYQVSYRFVGSRIHIARGLPVDFGLGEGSEIPEKIKEVEQYSVIDIQSGQILKRINLKKGFRLGNIYSGPKGQSLIYGYEGESLDYGLYLIKDDDIVQLPVLSPVQNAVTWTGEATFYYASSNNVYEYSLDKGVSYRVYADPSISISTLNNSFGSVFLSVFSGQDKNATYLRFVDKSAEGRRPEAILPFYNDILHSIKSARLQKNAVVIKPYDSSDKTKNSIINYLQSLGINTDIYSVRFE